MTKIKAKKVKMTQIWKNDQVTPVTVLLVEGKETPLDAFKEGEKVAVSGTSKGRGFQGVVKRHGFHGGPKSHGQKNRLRAPGSIGATAPQRVIKGRRMAGHMGNVRVTVRNLVIAQILPEERTIILRGAVPGSRGGVVEIRSK
jgi:large subunit ribosomal protein L3